MLKLSAVKGKKIKYFHIVTSLILFFFLPNIVILLLLVCLVWLSLSLRLFSKCIGFQNADEMPPNIKVVFNAFCIPSLKNTLRPMH